MIEVMMTLFAIVVVGYVAGRLGYMGGEFDKKLSSLVINFTCPALILASAMTGELPDRRLILPLLGISALTYVVLTGVAFPVTQGRFFCYNERTVPLQYERCSLRCKAWSVV